MDRAVGFGGWPKGSFYSPIPSMDEARLDKSRIFDRSMRELGGIDLKVDDQLQLLEELTPFYGEHPFQDNPVAGMRFYFNNNYISYSDSLFLYSIIRYANPKRIIEIGSGFSSFVMLDTNERFFDNSIRMTFIEPYPDRFRSRLKENDQKFIELIPKRAQDVDLSRFNELTAGDILFVDSSHVSKVGSDVNLILFEILPRLSPGVFVHFHDIHYPFEYPDDWILKRQWFWNEAYILRSFLQYNSAFKIRIWNQFLGTFFPEKLAKSMPLAMKNIGGSLWIQRV
jgi:hypothetical protein